MLYSAYWNATSQPSRIDTSRSHSGHGTSSSIGAATTLICTNDRAKCRSVHVRHVASWRTQSR
jgi:hypothetical protein